MKNKKFNLASYKYLFLIKSSRRKIYLLIEIFFRKKGIILRHDIDFSPAKALEIARLEYEIGVFTFFVMLK